MASLNPALHRLISVWALEHERSSMHNVVYSGQYAGYMVGSAVGGIVIAWHGWAAAFYAVAIGAAVWALLWMSLVSRVCCFGVGRGGGASTDACSPTLCVHTGVRHAGGPLCCRQR